MATDIQSLKLIYTESEIDAEIVIWKEALSKVASGQSYALRGRSLTRVDSDEICSKIQWFADIKAAYSDEATANSAPHANVGRPGRIKE